MTIEECAVFLFKRFSLMMAPLIANVSDEFRQMGLARCNRRVTILPAKSGQAWEGLLYPFRRAAFDQLYRCTQRQNRWKAEQQMDVIFHAAYKQCIHIVFSSDAPQIRPDALLEILSNPRFSVFGAENHMIVK